MAWTPTSEDFAPAVGQRFGVRLSSYVNREVLAVRGVRMRNTRLVAVVSVVVDDVTDEWSASLSYADRGELANPPDEEDGA